MFVLLQWRYKSMALHVRYIKILTWLRAFMDKIAIFRDSIVSQFPEEIWAQRKPKQIKKYDQKASE